MNWAFGLGFTHYSTTVMSCAPPSFVAARSLRRSTATSTRDCEPLAGNAA